MKSLAREVKLNNQFAVKSTLDNGFNINTRHKNGNTLLFDASIDMMALLIQYGIDVNLKNKKGMTALMHEVQNPDGYEKVQLLMNAGANIHLKNKQKTTLLMLAMKSGNINIVKLFVNGKINTKNNKNHTAFIYAIKYGNIEAIDLLYSHGAHIKCKTLKGYSPLSIAIQYQQTACVSWLLQYIDTNKINKGKTALMHAVGYDDETIVKILLSHGADVNISFNKKTALHYAIDHGKHVKLLLTYDHVDKIGPLKHAIDIHDEESVLLLLDDEIIHDVELLFLAIDNSLNQIVKYLLEKGLNANVKNNDGQRAIVVAYSRMEKEIVKLLLYHGATFSSKMLYGYVSYTELFVPYMTDEELFNINNEYAHYALKELQVRQSINRKKVQFYEKVLKLIPEHNVAIRYKIGNMGYYIIKYDFDKEINQNILNYFDTTPENLQNKVNDYLYNH